MEPATTSAGSFSSTDSVTSSDGLAQPPSLTSSHVSAAPSIVGSSSASVNGSASGKQAQNSDGKVGGLDPASSSWVPPPYLSDASSARGVDASVLATENFQPTIPQSFNAPTNGSFGVTSMLNGHATIQTPAHVPYQQQGNGESSYAQHGGWPVGAPMNNVHASAIPPVIPPHPAAQAPAQPFTNAVGYGPISSPPYSPPPPLPQELTPASVSMTIDAMLSGNQAVQGMPGQYARPQDASYQSPEKVVSPATTPHRTKNGSTSCPMSPEFPMSGRLTEPRNYAPRTSGLPAAQEPPPKFDLGLAAQQPQRDIQDPFGGAPSQASLAVQHPMMAGPVVSYQPAPTQQTMQYISSQRSEKLNLLTNNGTALPSLNTAMDPANLPFAESARQAQAFNHGVVKLRNIPFATKRCEVVAFLGRNSKILNDSEEPVHIIMERVTSKTMDAYVEFKTLEDAMKAVERHHLNLNNGRLSRLGDRPVEVELSSQSSLMKDLFPISTGVFWNGAVPEFKPYNHHEPWENFKGFISEEEMTMLVKHVEVPHRSPFSKECPQRPYECLISTLKKFPWYVTDRITISQRYAIYNATFLLLDLLGNSLQRGHDPINLTGQLHTRVVNAAMTCPGFTPSMKDNIAWMIGVTEQEQRAFGQPRFSDCWRHQYAISPKPGIPLDVLEWYIAIIREQSHRDIMARPLNERIAIQEKGLQTNMYWGYFWVEVGYGMGLHFDKMTLAQASHAEFSAIERILARVLPK
ncbi:hypothetical protein HJFPF1_05176 [Paramyrothecium foliicola]|nr:hypothetical protein HJFPF1_05176 [Paramyrothecium foliicola]